VVSGSLRVALQVVSAYRRPVIEVYHQVRNIFGPEHEFEAPQGADGTTMSKYKTRFQDIFVQFTLVNIGGVRAENIRLSIAGDLTRRPGRDFGGAFKHLIPQFAPGQMQYLFSLDQRELMQPGDLGPDPNEHKQRSFTITVEYDAPSGILNWLLALPTRCRGKKRFSCKYAFSPEVIMGDLPPPEYA
jgi:hypothetical protein